MFNRLVQRSVPLPARLIPRPIISSAFAMPPRRNASRAASAASTAKESNGAGPSTPSTSKAKAAASPRGQTKRKAADKEQPKAEELVKDDEGKESPPAKQKKPRTSKAKADAVPNAGGLPDSPAAPRGKDDDILAYDGCPKTVDIPNPLSFSDAPRKEGIVRVAAWNIVSLKSAEGKGLSRYIEAEDADVVSSSSEESLTRQQDSSD